MVTFGAPTPAMPTKDVARSVDFYADVLGFEKVVVDDGFALLRRDAATVTLWGATDDSWQTRADWARPVVSGAESFIAGTASFRVNVDGVDELYEQCKARDVVHPNAPLGDTDWGTREFGVLDPDGNLVGFWQERS
jgi:catechol 2,3-dioxygenase-like lactoylglutathione lyase family enzyme